MSIGKLTVSEAMTYLNPIAKTYGLKINRAKDLKLARMIFATIYCREIV
jgi:hypothetical protein